MGNKEHQITSENMVLCRKGTVTIASYIVEQQYCSYTQTSLLCAPYLSQLTFIAGGMIIMGILYKTRQLFCSSAGKKIEVYVCKEQKHTWRMSSKTTPKLYTQYTTPEPLIEGSGPSLGHILLHCSLSLSRWGVSDLLFQYLFSPLHIGSFHINFTKLDRNQRRNRQ